MPTELSEFEEWFDEQAIPVPAAPTFQQSTVWSIPNRCTFKIKPIRALLDRYIRPSDVIVDPMCRESLIGTYRNDIDPKAPGAITHMDAVAFLDDLLAKGIAADVVLWDPPFSVNQARKYGRKDETPHSFNVLRHECRNRIARLVRPGGLVICLAFHGNGLERPGFETIERLNVTHGGFSYDTIVVVQRRAPHALDQTQPN